MKNSITFIIKHIIPAAAATAVMLSSFVCAAAEEKEYDYISSPVPEKILVMGDSIATGYGLEGYDSGRENVRSYANMLKEEYSGELEQGEEELVNKAIDGQTSSELLEDLQKGDYDSYLEDCDLILISIGGNDLMHTVFGFFSENTDYGINAMDLLKEHSIGDLVEIYAGLSKVLEEKINTYGENLRAMSEYIKGKTDARIILQTVYNPFDTTQKPKLFVAFAKSKITGLNEKIFENVTDENGNDNYTIADIYEAFSGQGDTLTNIKKVDPHPNADGHMKIYQTLDELIRQTSYTIEVEKPETEAAQAQPAADNSENDSEKGMSDATKTALIISGGIMLLAIVVFVLILSRKKGSSE